MPVVTPYIKHLTYPLVIAVAVFLSFGGPAPTVKARQDGSTITAHNYGQPFNFHYKALYAKPGDTTLQIDSSPYETEQIAALTADIAIWSILIWTIVRMAEQKPILPRQAKPDEREKPKSKKNRKEHKTQTQAAP